MGWFSSSNSWTAAAGRNPHVSRASRQIIARHAKEEKAEKEAKDQRKADKARFGRRGGGIVCG